MSATPPASPPRRLRVVHVDSGPDWRGGQNQALLCAHGMAARGHDVTVVCRRGSPLAERASQAGLRVEATRFHGGDLSPASVMGLGRVLRQRRPDVLHMHDPHAIAAGLLARALAGDASRTVATRRVDFRVRGGLSRLKYRWCDRVIAVSDAIVRVLSADGVDPRQVRRVYEGVRDRPPEPGGEAALRELGIPQGAPVVGVVAALTPHKDHETLLLAARDVHERLPNVHFLLAGEGELRAALERRAAKLGLGSRCVFTGFRRDLDRLVPAFTVFCLSSDLEGLGTSLLDAMCFRRPIVATAAGGIPEAVKDGVTGRVVPVRDHSALAAALLELLTDTAQSERFGNAGRARFEHRFTDTAMVDATLAVYAELS